MNYVPILQLAMCHNPIGIRGPTSLRTSPEEGKKNIFQSQSPK